jgi:hypothetical protein
MSLEVCRASSNLLFPGGIFFGWDFYLNFTQTGAFLLFGAILPTVGCRAD